MVSHLSSNSVLSTLICSMQKPALVHWEIVSSHLPARTMFNVHNIQQLLDNIHLPPKKMLSPHNPKEAKYRLSKLLMYPPEFPVYPRHIWSKQIWGEYSFLLCFILQTFVIDGTVLIAGATVLCKDRHDDHLQRVYSLVRRKLTFIDVYSMPGTTLNILTVFSPLSSQD